MSREGFGVESQHGVHGVKWEGGEEVAIGERVGEGGGREGLKYGGLVNGDESGWSGRGHVRGRSRRGKCLRRGRGRCCWRGRSWWCSWRRLLGRLRLSGGWGRNSWGGSGRVCLLLGLLELKEELLEEGVSWGCRGLS